VPTYDYQCRSCGTVTEVIHAMTDDGPTVCGVCGGQLRRVLYPTGIIFKGSGFYRTDSRAAASTSTSESGSKPAADGATTESKPSTDGGDKAKKTPTTTGEATG
jgi:putative FmdB family regulatory protein